MCCFPQQSAENMGGEGFYIEIDETAGCAGELVRLERALAPLKRQAGD